MTPQSAKSKGRTFQQYICKRILDWFPSLEPDDVMSKSMGAGGEDVMLSPAARKLLPISIEAKNQEKVSLWASWIQAQANAGKYNPVLIIKRNRTKPITVIDLEYFLSLVKGHEIVFVEKETIDG